MLSLLKELEGTRWGEAEKLSRISLATSAESVISENIVCGTVSPSLSAGNLHSGGLFLDWNSEI